MLYKTVTKSIHKHFKQTTATSLSLSLFTANTAKILTFCHICLFLSPSPLSLSRFLSLIDFDHRPTPPHHPPPTLRLAHQISIGTMEVVEEDYGALIIASLAAFSSLICLLCTACHCRRRRRLHRQLGLHRNGHYDSTTSATGWLG